VPGIDPGFNFREKQGFDGRFVGVDNRQIPCQKGIILGFEKYGGGTVFQRAQVLPGNDDAVCNSPGLDLGIAGDAFDEGFWGGIVIVVINGIVIIAGVVVACVIVEEIVVRFRLPVVIIPLASAAGAAGEE
jgi:hypothetical protein